MIRNTSNAEHYKWGESSDGWHLLKSDNLSVIEENVPPGETEIRHVHLRAQQFFYVLEGIGQIEVAGELFELTPGHGIHVPPQTPHQLMNNGKERLRFLVISEPKSHGDRVSA